jgi:hypothetical protein
MNTNAVFGRAVLAGLRKRGLTDLEIRQISGIRAGTLELIRAGKRGFSNTALNRLESATGLDGGQLAALAAEPEGGPLTDLMKGWAEIRSLFKTEAGVKGRPPKLNAPSAPIRDVATTPKQAPRARSA